MLTLSEAAALLGVESGTLRRQVRLGKLKATKLGPIWTVEQAEVDRYRAENRRVKTWKPIDIDILKAVAQRWAGDPRWPNEILDKPDRLIERRMERLIARGYLESGVSTRTAWLTPKGAAVIGVVLRAERTAFDFDSMLRKVSADIARDIEAKLDLPDGVHVVFDMGDR